MLIAAVAFAGGGHDHGDESVSHAQEEAPDQGGGEQASVAITQWTDHMELFMEYPVLVVNEPGRFIIHLTVLDGFQPVRDGAVKLTFTGDDGHSHDVVETDLLREGIFAPTVELHDPGKYQFALVFNGSTVRDSFSIDGFTVYSSLDRIPYSEDLETGEEIGFLKEQQWKIPFATAQVETREIKRAVWAIGEVLPSPNAYVEIVSPVDGVVHVGENGQIALPGSIVNRGATLATISPPVQGNGWAASQLAYEQAKRDHERAKRLRERQAISEREFEKVRGEYLTMKAGFEALSGGGEASALELHAPIGGKIIEWQVRPGQRVSAGDKLMAIVDPATVWLRVNVYENDFHELGQPVGAYVKADGPTGGWVLSEDNMRVMTTGAALDPTTRTVPVLLEVSNHENRLRINESTPVELYSSEGELSPAIPRTAVYEDDGIDVVFVQTGGESFEKRIVTVGPRYNGSVSIIRGLHPGERIVSTGGYHVKLASTSAEIGHGHAH
jgi:RND family efflux transporter MFP subunit